MWTAKSIYLVQKWICQDFLRFSRSQISDFNFSLSFCHAKCHEIRVPNESGVNFARFFGFRFMA